MEAERLSVAWTPQPGPQWEFCRCPVFEVFYGGARGGGQAGKLQTGGQPARTRFWASSRFTRGQVPAGCDWLDDPPLAGGSGLFEVRLAAPPYPCSTHPESRSAFAGGAHEAARGCCADRRSRSVAPGGARAAARKGLNWCAARRIGSAMEGP